MNNKVKFCLAVFAFLGLTAMGPAPQPGPGAPVPPPSTPTTGTLSSYLESVLKSVGKLYPHVPQAALRRAFKYYQDRGSSITNQDFVTVVDFDKPSSDERMFVVDMRTGRVDSYLAAHGVNSGENYATKFSNQFDTRMSSVGIYLTGNEYEGDHGLSMLLHGKESSNSNAEGRAIVMHSADYVSDEFVRANGRLGRSWGCPAIENRYREELVKKLQDGSVFYIYHSSYCNSTGCRS